MAETLKNVASLLRSVVTLCVLAAISFAGWFGYQALTARSTLVADLARRDAEIGKLKVDLAAQAEHIEELDLALRLLKRDHRLALITVLEQKELPGKKRPMTRFEFVDVDDDDRPIDKPRQFTIEGDVLYVEAWVVKYLDQHVERADPLRGTSICLFKRVYGEFQEPSEGFVLDAVDSRPAAYGRGEQMPEFERKIWAEFWEFANEPDKAEKAGIRAAHGEAPSIKLRPGKSYLVELRASAGLSIKPIDRPPAEGKQL